ncbi:MAG: ABC transporter ATP-binding protein [Thermoproteus sp.]|jgi:iron complex transport system ATP-binding protein|nr:MAG: iron ABC transporter ATP-binding protein [Thermoproteus sp. CIS_19]
MRVRELTVSLGGVPVLVDVSFDIVDGLNLVLGPNGSGKTTLLRTIAGIYRPQRGSVEVDGDVGYMPAEFSDAYMTVMDVLLAGGGRPPSRYLAWLAAVGLGGYERRIFSELSTGQKRLVLLAKALAEGRLVLLDEPTANLDPARKAVIMRVLQRLKKLKTFIVASHDLDLVNIADSVVLLRGGRAVQLRPEEVDGEVLSETYGLPIEVVQSGGHKLFLPRYDF